MRNELFEPLNSAEVFGGKDVFSVLGLLYFEELTGSSFFCEEDFVAESTGVVAFSFVSRSASEVVPQQTSTRVGHAHCSVDEGFQFDFRDLLFDGDDFIDVQFASEDDSFYSQICPEFYRSVVERCGLCGEVERGLG